MRYTYEIYGDHAEKQKTTSVNVNRVPSFDCYREIEIVLRGRFKNFIVEKITHSATGTGAIVINYRPQI